ncbi:MAG: hypothetical protein E7522_02065 [Ruminococcaceae bacterium]|nr:hypothetical protein [Oscillospiraceae bacterium]
MIGLCEADASGRIMTKQKIYKLKTRIEEARSNLLNTNPFYAIMLMYLKFVAVSDIKSISTDGVAIYFSPSFLEKLYPDELEYILCHQVLHIVFGDIWDLNASGSKDYHLACDEFVNQELRQAGYLKKRYAHLGDFRKPFLVKTDNLTGWSRDELFRSMCFSLEVFDERIQKDYLPDSNFYWGSDPETSGGTLILDIAKNNPLIKMQVNASNGAGDDKAGSGENGDEKTSEDNQIVSDISLKEMWGERAKIIGNIMKQYGCGIGSVPGDLECEILKTDEKVVDWRKLLIDFVQETISDYSFSPPDRRYSDTDFFLPDFNENSAEIKNVLFMIDTSGSVDARELGRVYSELSSAIEMFNGCISGYIGFFDTEVSKVEPLSECSDVYNITPSGGGGTDFHCIFRYVKNKMQDNLPSCIIIFTDGFGSCPETAPINIPILWLVSSKEKLPFGRVVRYSSET